MKKYQPAIVVVAFNRPRSITRILASLKNAKIKDDTRLIISIDNDDGRNTRVKEIADAFEWPFGDKDVRYQPQRLGLRKHIIQCADLSQEFGSVIILEDDLAVSPYFYDYAMEALSYYDGKDEIAGISLYNQPRQEVVQYPFRPLYDNSDVYFMQFPSSLGQAWTAGQWKAFRTWYDTSPDLHEVGIPDFIAGWPDSSWKKYFVGYLFHFHKYFVFPQFSLTTNFNDPGTNLTRLDNHEGQSPLRMVEGPYRFKDSADSFCRYDVHLDLESGCLKQLCSHLDDYDFELDLYAAKDLDKLKSEYLITIRPSKNPVKGFRRAMKPHEMNVIYNLEGEDIVLSRVEDVLPGGNKYEVAVNNYKYFYNRRPIGWKAQAHIYLKRLKSRFS